MEIRDCIVGDGDEQEWEYVVFLYWVVVIGGELGQCWYFQFWYYDQDVDGQCDDCVDFEEG